MASVLKPSKVAVQFLRCLLVCCAGFFRSGEAAKKSRLPVCHDLGNKWFARVFMTVPCDALKAGGILFANLGIMHIVRMAAQAQITASIVQSIAVNMIDKLSRLGLQYHPMHSMHMAMNLSHSILQRSIGRSLEAPVVRGYKFSVDLIV